MSRFKLFLYAAFFFLLASNSSLSAQQNYKGPLFDAHAHLSKRSSLSKAYADYKEAGFEKAVLFADIYRAKGISKAEKELFMVFSDPFKRKKGNYRFSEKRLSTITKALEKKEVHGFGEIYFRLGWAPFAKEGITTDINGKEAKKLLSVARTHNATVHIHLDSVHANVLTELLIKNPHIQFILAHCGFFKPGALSSLFDKHPNLFAEISLVFNPYNKRFSNLPILDGKLKPDWKALLIRHADRLMIGTDYTSRRSEQLPNLATYYRKILGMIPEAEANKIAHENFSKLFVKREAMH